MPLPGHARDPYRDMFPQAFDQWSIRCIGVDFKGHDVDPQPCLVFKRGGLQGSFGGVDGECDNPVKTEIIMNGLQGTGDDLLGIETPVGTRYTFLQLGKCVNFLLKIAMQVIIPGANLTQGDIGS